MKEIRINFSGFWNNFNYKDFVPYKILTRHFDVSVSSNPDYLFCSIFDGYNFCESNAIRIFCTSECFIPDMNLFDYALSIDNIKFGDRIIQFPYFMYIPNVIELKDRPQLLNKDLKKKELFCNFIYSHGTDVRDKIFDLLSSYRRVDSAGKHLNNMNGFSPGARDKVTGVDNDAKLEFLQKYRFTIACENYCYPDYITEKIVHAFMGRTVPIFYGDSSVNSIFNPKAFVNYSSYINDVDFINAVRRIDENDDVLLDMLNEPVFVDGNFINDKFDELEMFLLNIFSQDYIKAYRRPQSFNALRLERQLLEITKEHSLKSRIYRIIHHK